MRQNKADPRLYCFELATYDGSVVWLPDCDPTEADLDVHIWSCSSLWQVRKWYSRFVVFPQKGKQPRQIRQVTVFLSTTLPLINRKTKVLPCFAFCARQRDQNHCQKKGNTHYHDYQPYQKNSCGLLRRLQSVKSKCACAKHVHAVIDME